MCVPAYRQAGQGFLGLLKGPTTTMKFILGLKGKMTTLYTEEGVAYAATVINATPNIITQIKTKDKEGYNAVQLGAVEKKPERVNKPQIGHVAKVMPEGTGKALAHFKEMRQFNGELPAGIEVGTVVDVSVFAEGDKVEVSAITKGRGFQGVIKRHGFHGGPRSHGQKHSERSPGSIGGSGGRAGGRVAKGMRMAGRMGQDRMTVRGLKVLQVLPDTNEIVISGAVPGRRGTLVEIKGIAHKQ
jgi:large subunit ribosomal protein L3